MTALYLRELCEQDIDNEYVSWFSTSDGHLAYYTGSQRQIVQSDLLKDWADNAESGKIKTFLVFAENGDRVGNVRLGPIDAKNKTADLPTFIGNRHYLGRGLAPQIIRMGNEIAFRDYGLRRLQGGMFEKNIASVKAYLRAGWYVEGRFKGYYLTESGPQDRICVACLNPAYFDATPEGDPYGYLDQ